MPPESHVSPCSCFICVYVRASQSVAVRTGKDKLITHASSLRLYHLYIPLGPICWLAIDNSMDLEDDDTDGELEYSVAQPETHMPEPESPTLAPATSTAGPQPPLNSVRWQIL